MKKLLALLLALVMIVGLVACGAKEEAAAPAATEAAPAAKEEAVAPAEKELEGELVFLDVMPSDEHTAIMEYILDDFMAQNPGVTVEYTSVPATFGLFKFCA